MVGRGTRHSAIRISSGEAFVASRRIACLNCREDIEVICIYCESGVDTEIDNPVYDFTVSNIWAVDDALDRALRRWPCFRKGSREGGEDGNFANHCPHCGSMQEDHLLHSEPEDVFFGITMGEPGSVEFAPIAGRDRLSGDYGFGV
jgi:hypothetical protein